MSKSQPQPHHLMAEAALSFYESGEILEYGENGHEREICVLFAKSSRCALTAIAQSLAGQADPAGVNLLATLSEIATLDSVPVRESASHHARTCMRVLALDQYDVGIDYLTRDLFSWADIDAAKKAAAFFCDDLCRRLLGKDLEYVLLTFYKHRRAPTVETDFWRRRQLSLARRSVTPDAE